MTTDEAKIVDSVTGDPVRIMLDGMNEKPIAIPFPFLIGEYEITDPDDWHWFINHYAELQTENERLKHLLDLGHHGLIQELQDKEVAYNELTEILYAVWPGNQRWVDTRTALLWYLGRLSELEEENERLLRQRDNALSYFEGDDSPAARMKAEIDELKQNLATVNDRAERLGAALETCPEWIFDDYKKVWFCLSCKAESITLEWAGIITKHASDCKRQEALK